MLGHAIGSPRGDKRAGGSSDLRLRIGSDLCLPVPLDCGASTLRDTCQLDQHRRCDGTDWMQTRALENKN